MKKLGIFYAATLITLPVLAEAANFGRAENANDLAPVSTTTYTGTTNRNIFTTFHDQSQVNTDTNNLNEDQQQLNADERSGDAYDSAADRTQVASDRAKLAGDYKTYNTGNNIGVYSNINTPVTVTHTDRYHQVQAQHQGYGDQDDDNDNDQ